MPPALPMPPAPPTLTKKPLWRNWWFWVSVAAVLAVVASLAGEADTDGSSTDAGAPTLSTQPMPSPELTSLAETFRMPDLVGLSLTKASDLAQQTGFDLEVEKKYSSKPGGTVLSIGPVAGTQLEQGSTVQVVVAKPFPHIPNVVGDNLKAARRTLEAKGFKVQVKKQTSSQPKDTVISQSPSAGTAARPGRKVTLVVANPAPSTSGGGGSNCTAGYTPCLTSGPSDYDCYGGSGNGPAYTEPGVTYRVTGADPYDLDSDGDGYGCE